MSEARLEDLEMRLTFQESALHTMSDEMAKQQQQIESLQAEVDLLKKALRAAVPSPMMNPADEPPPPHY